MNTALDVKQSYDLVDYIASDLNQTGRKEGNNIVAFRCPFHNDQNPSLKVNISKQYVTCYSERCIEGGDIIKYVELRQRVDFTTALQILQDKKPLGPVQTPRLVRQHEPVKTIDFRSRVEELRPNIPDAKDYFNGRGIIELEERLLTLDPGKFFFVRHQYRSLEAIDAFKEWLVTPRYILPHMDYGKVRAVNTRRDDRLCGRLYEQYEDIFRAIAIDIGESRLKGLKETGAEIPYFEELMPDRASLLDHVFGEKYLMWRGSRRGVFNRARISTEDFQPKPLSYCLITEGEITALSLEDITPEVGFQAVAAKSLRGLDKAFQGVGQIWVLGEHDTPRVDRRTGETYSASERNIEQLLHAVGRWHDHSAKILYPPKEAGGKSINDFNDFILADRPAAIAYLQEKVPLVGRELLTA